MIVFAEEKDEVKMKFQEMLVTYKDKKDIKEMLKSFQVEENIVPNDSFDTDN